MKKIHNGIIFCVLGSALFLFAVLFWVVEVKSGAFPATAMAGGFVGGAIALFKLGLSFFNISIREILKEIYPIFIPVIVALWPLLIWGVYLPSAEHKWQVESEQYKKAQKVIKEILAIDPDRLVADSNNTAAEFDYASAIDRTATSCGIHTADYKINSGIIITSSGQKSQSAKVSLKSIDLTRCAKFLSTLQLRWANLQCNQVKLTKKKGLPDSWDFDIEFKYYY